MIDPLEFNVLNFSEIRVIKLIFCKKLILCKRLMMIEFVFVSFYFFQCVIGLIPNGVDFLMCLYKLINTLLISISGKLIFRTKTMIKSCSSIWSGWKSRCFR